MRTTLLLLALLYSAGIFAVEIDTVKSKSKITNVEFPINESVYIN